MIWPPPNTIVRDKRWAVLLTDENMNKSIFYHGYVVNNYGEIYWKFANDGGPLK